MFKHVSYISIALLCIHALAFFNSANISTFLKKPITLNKPANSSCTVFKRNCSLGNINFSESFLLIGDSTVTNIIDPLNKNLENLELRGRAFTDGGCIFIEEKRNARKSCNTVKNQFNDFMNIRDINFLVISQLWHKRYNDTQLVDVLRSFSEKLDANRKDIKIILVDTFSIDSIDSKCFGRPDFLKQCSKIYFSKDQINFKRINTSKALRAFSDQNKNVFYIDFLDSFCNESRCNFFDENGKNYFYDESHMTRNNVDLPLLNDLIEILESGAQGRT